MTTSHQVPRLRTSNWALALALPAAVTLSSCGGGGGDCSGPFCIGPEPPQATTLKKGQGDGQQGAPGRQLPQALEVLVTDNDNRPIQDVVVKFSVGSGGGALSDTEIRSDVQGHARVSWTLGSDPGAQSAQATANGASGTPLSGAPVTFSAQAVQPIPVRLVIRQAPSVSARNGIPLEQQPIVEVLDAQDQPVSQVQVTASIASGGGTLSGTTAATSDAEGRAAYTDLALVGPSGSRSLKFSVAAPQLEVVSGAIIVGAGGPAQITGVAPLTYQGTVGSPVDPAPSVIVKDAAGNPVPGIAVSFTADRDASVSPETVNTDDHGVAQVTSWTLGTSANVQYNLTARVEGSTLAPVRFTAMARAGAAGGLRIATQPSATAQNGVPFAQQPAIQVVDRDGNPAPQAGVQITASIAAGPNGALQNATATTDAAGLATFTGLTLTGTVGNYTISFSAQGLAGAMSNPVALAAGPAAQLAFVVAPPTEARSRAAMAPLPAIQVQDASGNAVAQSDILIVAGLQGEGTLSGETAATDATGKATFTQLAIYGPPGQKTLTFSSPGSSFQAISAQVTLPPVASIKPHPGTPLSGTVGTTLTAVPLAILTDVSGQPVADAAFTLSFGGGTVSLLPLSGISGADGSVTADSWQLGTATGDQLAQVNATGTVPLVIHLQATAAAPVLIQKISGDNQSAPSPPANATDPALPNPLVVQVTDQYGNGVGGALVQWRTCDGAGNYDQATDGRGFSSSRQPIQPAAAPGTYCTRASVAGTSLTVDFSYTITASGTAMSQSRTSQPGFRTQGLPPAAPKPSDARRPHLR